MRRLPAILLLIAIPALGSGLLRFLHDREHAVEDAQAAMSFASSHGHDHRDHDDDEPHHAPVAPPISPHDRSNCATHAHLSLPMISAGWVPLLICLGLFIAFLTCLPAPVRSHRPVLNLRSRSPPLVLSISF